MVSKLPDGQNVACLDFCWVIQNQNEVVNLVLQNSMNLPPDKVRLLRSYDNEKKWELICDQVSVGKVNSFYLE